MTKPACSLQWLVLKKHINIVGTLAAFGAIFSWATGPLFVYYLSGYLDGWSQNFWRYTIAFLVWLPFLCFSLWKGQVESRLWRWALLPAVFNIILQSFWAWGLYYIEPGFVALLARTSLFWVLLFSFLVFPEERSLAKSKTFWLGIGVSLAGIVLVIVNKEGFTAGGNRLGIILILVAEIAWALYTISARKVFRQTDSRLAFSVLSLYTAIGLAVLAILFGRPSEVFHLPSRAIVYMIVSGIVCISLSHIFYYKAMKSIGTTITTVIMQCHPFIVIVLSMLVFSEKLNGYQWAGGGVVLAGSILAILSQKKLGSKD